ncbi:hypothetical protein [Lentilitoribacter sp. EG35]|uniref:hypothetical protein n=1 Tax=Lentilitoribacter sp. EG35 TaxID=3234192 RepID=UPI00346011B5
MLNIADLRRELNNQPTIICDVDEVVIEFLTPFRNFLNSLNLDLVSNSFALHGNIIAKDTGGAVDDRTVSHMINELYANQLTWQTAVPTAANTLHELSTTANIVFLTAMPPEYYVQRRELLDSFDMPFPLFAAEGAKGPLIKQLTSYNEHASFFIDDMVYNHKSSKEHSPETHSIHIMANDEFKAISPAVTSGTFEAANWLEIKDFIVSKI